MKTKELYFKGIKTYTREGAPASLSRTEINQIDQYKFGVKMYFDQKNAIEDVIITNL
jgi:hypothetical protein